MANYFDPKLTGKTIDRVEEHYEPVAGYKIWTTRMYFTDGTSTTLSYEWDEKTDTHNLVMRVQEEK